MLEAVREYLQEYAPNDLQVKGELCCDRCTGGPNIFFDEQQVNVDSAAGLVSFLKQRCK